MFACRAIDSAHDVAKEGSKECSAMQESCIVQPCCIDEKAFYGRIAIPEWIFLLCGLTCWSNPEQRLSLQVGFCILDVGKTVACQICSGSHSCRYGSFQDPKMKHQAARIISYEARYLDLEPPMTGNSNLDEKLISFWRFKQNL